MKDNFLLNLSIIPIFLIGLFSLTFIEDKSISTYIILKRDSGKDDMLILAKLVRNDTVIIDTFFRTFDYTTKMSYTLVDNKILYLYSESLMNYDPSATAEIMINFRIFNLKENEITETSNEFDVIYKKQGNHKKGYIKDNKLYVICSNSNDSSIRNFKYDTISNININKISSYFNYCDE